MDRLARNAMLARKAGMTYGKWKALQPVLPPEEKPLPEGWKKCEECGKPFKARGGVQRFCELGCREKAHWRRKNQKRAEYMRQYRASKKEEQECTTNTCDGSAAE